MAEKGELKAKLQTLEDEKESIIKMKVYTP